MARNTSKSDEIGSRRPGRGGPVRVRTVLATALLVLLLGGVAAACVTRTNDAQGSLPIDFSSSPTSTGSSGGISAPEAKARGEFAAPGDGTVRITNTQPTGSSVNFSIEVRNAGDVRATYTVSLRADDASRTIATASVDLDGGATRTVTMTVKTSTLSRGQHTITAGLRSNLIADIELSTDSVSVTIN